MSKKEKNTKFIIKLKGIVDKIKIRHLSIITVLLAFAIIPDNVIIQSLQSKAVKEKVQIYIDYSNILRDFIPTKCILWFLVLITIIIWMLKAYFYFFYKEPIEKQKEVIYILGHSSLNKTQFRFNRGFLKEHQPEISEIDLIGMMKKVEKNYESLSNIINMQDNLIENFQKKINDNSKYGYLGIAHIPLVLRAGYKMGDEVRFALFHKKRNEAYYDELNYSDEYEKIKVEKIHINTSSKELVVAISTTFQIEDSHLKVFETHSKNLLKFSLKIKGFDVISSYKQVDEYVDFIQNKIRQVVRKNNIRKVHMVISSSVAFTFALGQSISKNHDCETIVYHYDKNHSLLYPWGINLFSLPSECVCAN